MSETLIAHNSEVKTEAPSAGSGARILAYIIDAVLISVIGEIAGKLVAAIIPAGSFYGGFIFLMIINILVVLGYSVVPIYKTGQTLGKLILGIKITATQGQLTFGRIMLREFIGKFISAIILGIGFLIAFFRQDRLALHDIIFHTRVVAVNKKAA